MALFRTYLIVSRHDTEKVRALHGADTRFVFRDEPTGTYWQDAEGKGFAHFPQGRDAADTVVDMVPQREFFLNIATEDEAESIAATLVGGMLLGFPSPGDLSIDVSEVSENFNEVLYMERWYQERFGKAEHFYYGHQVLHAAQKDKVSLYAIEKYAVSIQLSSFHPYKGSPRYGQLFTHYETKYVYHTKAAFAIISAFSAIEEMGLEVRSSAQKPRFLNKDTGQWNPVVLQDVETRLAAIGIVSTEQIDWIFRGDFLAVAQDVKPYFGAESEWADGATVRDKTLTFPEAIHNASYLRNFIAAHKFNELTAFINPYDVFNLQNLVRQLILRKLALWKTEDQPKKDDSA